MAAELHVDQIWTDTLNPRPRVWTSVQEVLRRHFPNWYGPYRGILFDPACRRAYQQELDERIRRAAARANLTDRLA